MGKIVINHARAGVVLDIDALQRFLDEAKAAVDGDRDSIEALPDSAYYVAQMLAPLLDDDARRHEAWAAKINADLDALGDLPRGV